MADLDIRYNDLCRLCATKTSIVLGINIFDQEGAVRDVFKKIETCLPVHINQSDDLPKMICQNCLYKVEVLFDFRERAVRTESLLQDLFKEIRANRMQKINIAELEQQVYIVNQPDGLNYQQLPNVNELLTQRDQEIILTQNIPLENIEINAQEFHGLPPQNIILENGMQFQEQAIIGEQFLLSNIPLNGNLQTERADKTGVLPVMSSSLKHHDSSNESGTLLISEGSEYYFKEDELHIKADELDIKADEVNVIYCDKCGKSFEDKAAFEMHEFEHSQKCDECGIVFDSKDSLNMHRKESHGNSNENEVGEKLEEEDEMKVEEVEKKPQSLDCKECGKVFKTNYKLREHMRKHSSETPYKCSKCDKAFKSKIGLAQHEASHTGLFLFYCITCGKGFQCKSYLMVHQRVHSDLKPFKCDTCGQGFKTKQSLLDHTNRHLGVKPYICDICGRGFITNAMCKTHQKIHSGLDNRKYSCKVCNKKFVSKSYLQTHIRIHTGEKPFICEVCGKGFLTRVDLKIHSTMHTGEKSYVCEVCGKAFARRDALRCHGRSHTGERPYSCNICGQTFTQYTPMAIHRRLHTGERPYKCDECGKRFVSKSTMVVHRKKHSSWVKQEPKSEETPCQN